MTSQINPSNIDITYPIAGQDNDTQGFRNNYINIRNNFNIASSEISNLQSNVIVLQTEVYANANTAAYLTTYNGNISVSNAVLTGNLTTNGARIEAGYQYYAPATNFYYTVNNNVSRFIMDPAGAITNGTVVLPSANVDATVLSISATQTVTNFRVLPNTGTTLVPSANVTLTGGTSVDYFYHASEAKWYKVR
jgi:hypothetical protein